jgi:hypothetical protein
MQDSMSSAERYFLRSSRNPFKLHSNRVSTPFQRFYLRFKSNDRQFALNILQGIEVKDDSGDANNSVQAGGSYSSLNKSGEETEEMQLVKEENIRQLVADCRKQLIGIDEDCYGSWALVSCVE